MAAAREAPAITVNGRGITPRQIHEEMQYHPAESLPAAQHKAAQALVVRELLLQEAAARGFLKEPCSPAQEQEAIDALLKSEIQVPAPDADSCRRYYQKNRQRFFVSPLFEASHILFAAPAQDPAARAQALKKAEEIADLLQKHPERFEDLARAHSACPSAKDGGRLGQVSKGQTAPEFEAALLQLQKGETAKAPVATMYGYHLIRVHERIEGKELPFETVQDWIADYLRQSAWQRAVSQYIAILAGKAEITGFQLKAADSPLVQ